MYLKSKFPQPPPVPNENAFYRTFGRPQDPQPADFLIHVDAITGKRRSYYELKQVIHDGNTALGSPESSGGLGLNAEARHMVGIYSHNCMVGARAPCSSLVSLMCMEIVGLRRPGTQSAM
jgi:hypothetical protein